MRSDLVPRKVKRTFLGEGMSEVYRKGIIIHLDPQRAIGYDGKGLTEPPQGPPSKARSMAASAARKDAAKAAKGARPAESKESPAKDASGLEPWSLAMAEETYVAKYDGQPDNSPAVVENLKLAKARIKAGASLGAK